jgi:hypothetical protein
MREAACFAALPYVYDVSLIGSHRDRASRARDWWQWITGSE